MNEIRILPLLDIPEISSGDNLALLIINAIEKSENKIVENDVLIVTQKIVSKSEGMVRNLEKISFNDLLKEETVKIIRKRGDLVIAQTKHGFICANAGIDKSNVESNFALLLPKDPNKSAHSIRMKLESHFQIKLAVIISDTFGRAWRKGQVNFAIGSSGINPIVNYIGTLDTFKNELQATEIAIIDELASAAELVMEKSINVPVAIIRGVNFEASELTASELIRDNSEDFFL
ncbi:MAG: coenzyme F420-0:L-glutamate ligase [Candidatus Actinomarina sp.]|nr:coenzyme F420-0:L-glutamate ligase [Actinomycetota bacterium]